MSSAMVDQMRRKDGGSEIEVVVGDMTNCRVEGAFSLVFLVFNTIDNLTTQQAQVACFENAARHLAPGGRFLVETQVPPIQRIPFGEDKVAFACDDAHWGVDEFNTVDQTYSSHHIWLRGSEIERLSVPFRYAWPAEMDLMAQIAGMTLESRWEDWSQRPFTSTSRKHISVWRKGGVI